MQIGTVSTEYQVEDTHSQPYVQTCPTMHSQHGGRRQTLQALVPSGWIWSQPGQERSSRIRRCRSETGMILSLCSLSS